MSKTYFMHYRGIDSDTGEKVAKGGATVAIRVVDNKLAIAYTLCSTKDVFSKARGRQVAEGRLDAFLTDRADVKMALILESFPPDESIKIAVDEALGDTFNEMGYF
jgi:hypothetical protein